MPKRGDIIRSGDLAFKDGQLQTDLNADLFDGKDSTEFAPSSHIGTGGAAHALVTTGIAGFMSPADKIKIDGIADGAEVNQNAFSQITINGQSPILAGAESDSFELIGGTGISLTADPVTNAVTITALNEAKAVDSEKLDGLDSTQFLRSDVADTKTANLTMAGENGISMGGRFMMKYNSGLDSLEFGVI